MSCSKSSNALIHLSVSPRSKSAKTLASALVDCRPKCCPSSLMSSQRTQTGRTRRLRKCLQMINHDIVLSVPQIYELINTRKSNGGLGSSQTVKHRVANEKDQCEREAFREFAHVTIPPKDIKKVITFDEMHRGKNERKTKKSLSPMSRRKEVALSSEPAALFFRMDFIESINHRQTRMLRLAFPPRACIPILDRFASYSQATPPL